MLTGIKGLTLAQYQSLRYLLIKQVEGAHGGMPYFDNVRQVNVGFNIEGNDMLSSGRYASCCALRWLACSISAVYFNAKNDEVFFTDKVA